MENNIFNDENIAKYFAGELEENILEKMEDQIINDNEKEKHIKDFSHLWEKSAELGKYEKIDLESDWRKVKNRMGFKAKSKKIPLRSYFLRIAAILIFAFGLAYFFNQLVNNYSSSDNNDYFTVATKDQLKEFVLPDNSVITLNKNSSVIYISNFGVGNRDIIVEGEAYFNVQKNKELPFRVFAENSTVEVLGTQFNVDQKDDYVKVSVVKGHVAFYETEKKQNRIDLLKSEESVYHKRKKTFDNKAKMNLNSVAWKTKKFEFSGESMNEVLYYISDYYNLELINNFTSPKDIPMGSIPVYNSVDSVMNSIILTVEGSFQYKIENNKLIVSD
jgi:ferric-dicitrate binding protein FerR (iron transport regulator)